MSVSSSGPDPASIAATSWLVPPVLRYVAGRGDRVYVLLSGIDPATLHSACAIVRSDDAGLTWGAPKVLATSLGATVHRDGSAETRWLAHAIAVDAADADRVYVTLESRTEAARRYHVAGSADGGDTFALVELACAGLDTRGHTANPEFADLAIVAGHVLVTLILQTVVERGNPFTSPAPSVEPERHLLTWRLDGNQLESRSTVDPSATVPLASGQSARLDGDARAPARVFYLTAAGIRVRELLDGVTFGEEGEVEHAEQRGWGHLSVTRAGERTAVLWQSKAMFSSAPPLLRVAEGPASAFEPKELSLGSLPPGRVQLELAGPTSPLLLSWRSRDATRLFWSDNAGDTFSTAVFQERLPYRGFQAHDTGHGLVVIARSPEQSDEQREVPVEPCIALRIGFDGDMQTPSVQRVPVLAGGPRPSFDAWLGTRSSYVLQRGEELDEESTQVSRIGGPAIGIREWPEADGVPLQHILTIDLRRQREDGHPGPAAVALFAVLCDDFGQAMYQVVELSDEDLVAPTPTPFPGDEVDARLAVASELVLEEPTEWADSFCGGYAGYIQGTDLRPSASEEDLVGHAALLDASGPFLLRFGESLFPEFDFGDGGIVYVHRRNAWLEMS